MLNELLDKLAKDVDNETHIKHLCAKAKLVKAFSRLGQLKNIFNGVWTMQSLSH